AAPPSEFQNVPAIGEFQVASASLQSCWMARKSKVDPWPGAALVTVRLTVTELTIACAGTCPDKSNFISILRTSSPELTPNPPEAMVSKLPPGLSAEFRSNWVS